MALWLVRAGSHGEYEQRFFDDNRIYLTWGRLNHDFTQCKNRKVLTTVLEQTYPNAPVGRIRNSSARCFRR